MAVKIKDYITRDTKLLMQTFNVAPKLECVIQNQRLILEATCDVRKELLHVIHLLSWLESPAKLKARAMKEDVPIVDKMSKKEEAALPFEARVKLISSRQTPEEAPTDDEDVEAF